MTNKPYDHTRLEKKWQEAWAKKGLYNPDIKEAKKPFYNLWMFPYPSAEGLHAGHAFASTGSDIYGRLMRMKGRSVFQPIGYDSFGIHSENYALSINEKPEEVVKRTTKHYEEQMKSLGHGYDWTKTVTTSDPDYYRWTKWLFVQMFKKGLAYKKKAQVNFCPSCKTVLADEQVMTPAQAGKEAKNAQGERVRGENLKVCERCGTLVEKKSLAQWFLKITTYADRLLAGLDEIDWSERVIKAQREWIGKSEGMLISFKGEKGKEIKVFTTRPDTLNAVTFLATSKNYEEGSREKKGKFSGHYASDPLSGRKLPVWDTNYIAPDYGTGVVMGVPAHDERDLEFAKKYKIDIVRKKPDKKLWQRIEEEGWGKRQTNYHLRDWLVSRQRYWGAPIPMIDCPKCGWQSVPEEDLPVRLPNISDYKPEGTGKGPLASHEEFFKTVCPNCGGEAVRETDVMDTFVDSSWYFLRYPSVGLDKAPFDPEITKKWLPVSLYFGGAEHSVLHLMYARFVTMVLKDAGLIGFEEPFPKFFAHGLMIKDGAKMSKSRGNVVNPDEYVAKYGADALRLYLAFMGPMDASPDFRDTGIEGMARFVKRVWRLFNEERDVILVGDKDAKDVLTKMHQTIAKVTKEIGNFKYNTAIAALMEFVNLLTEKAEKKAKMERKGIKCAEWEEALETLALLLAPFAPHMAEEIWVEILGKPFSIHTSAWPQYSDELVKEERVVIAVQVNGRLRGQVELSLAEAQDEEEVATAALKEKSVAKWLEGQKRRETYFVPKRIINFVLK